MLKTDSLKKKIGLSAALLSTVSFLTLVSCGGGTSSSVPEQTQQHGHGHGDDAAAKPTDTEEAEVEADSGVVETVDDQSTSTSTTAKKTLEKKLKDTVALRDEVSASRDVDSKELAEKQELYTKLESELKELRESEDVDTAKMVVATTKLETEIQQQTRDFSISQQNVASGFSNLQKEAVEATNALANAGNEFMNLREFGKANVGKEILLYLFGFKLVWGLFIGYRVTSFTYEPEYANDLLYRLTEIRNSLEKVLGTLANGVVQTTSEKTMENINGLHALVDHALNFFKDNKQARWSKAVKLPSALFEKLKALLELASELPEEQAKLEQTRAKIDNYEVSKKEREVRMKKLKTELERTFNDVNVLIEKVRIGTAKLTQLNREIELLEGEVKG